MFKSKCTRCHAKGKSRSKSPLTSYTLVKKFVKPGNSKSALLKKKVHLLKYLTGAEFKIIQTWIVRDKAL